MATITAKEFAAKVDSDGRTVRKFLRNEFGTVGKGARWAIESKQVRSLESKFTKWNDARLAKMQDEEVSDPDDLPDDDEMTDDEVAID